jgi:hypothetical protein
MKVTEGMMVFHDQFGAGKVLNVDSEGSMAATVAFLQYAPWTIVYLEHLKICDMRNKWPEVQDLFRKASDGTSAVRQ